MRAKFVGVSAAKPGVNGEKSYKSLHFLLDYDQGTGNGQYPKSYSVEASFNVPVEPGEKVIFHERFYGLTKSGQPMVGIEDIVKDTST